MTNPKDVIGAKKAPLDGVPAAGAIFSAPAHANGHAKHGYFNWREQPVQAMIYIGAIQRHIAAWVDGEDLAQDSGVHHLAHALAGLNIIADAMGLGTLIDNRPPKGPAAAMLRVQDHSEAPAPVETPATFAYKHADGTCPECSTIPFTHGEPFAFNCTFPECTIQGHKRTLPLVYLPEPSCNDDCGDPLAHEPYRELGGEG